MSRVRVGFELVAIRVVGVEVGKLRDEVERVGRNLDDLGGLQVDGRVGRNVGGLGVGGDAMVSGPARGGAPTLASNSATVRTPRV